MGVVLEVGLEVVRPRGSEIEMTATNECHEFMTRKENGFFP